MHASFLRRVLFRGTEPARMPMSPGLLFDRGWVCAAGAAAAPAAARGTGNQERTACGGTHGGRRRMNGNPPQNRGLTAIDGAMVLIVVLLIVQIWLLSATLEAFLAGHREAAVPGAVISGLLFLACLGLYFFVDRIDSEVRKG